MEGQQRVNCCLYFSLEKNYNIEKMKVGWLGAKLVFHVDMNRAYLSWEAVGWVAKGESDLRLLGIARTNITREEVA